MAAPDCQDAHAVIHNDWRERMVWKTQSLGIALSKFNARAPAPAIATSPRKIDADDGTAKLDRRCGGVAGSAATSKATPAPAPAASNNGRWLGS